MVKFSLVATKKISKKNFLTLEKFTNTALETDQKNILGQFRGRYWWVNH